jgi:hypothetical protein
MPAKEVDAYTNLMLLCPSDHKIVDEQVTYYKWRVYAKALASIFHPYACTNCKELL